MGFEGEPATVPADAPLHLVLIRHGAWSPTGPDGTADPDAGLSPHGRAQARACGRWLRSVPLLRGSDFALRCSPARRAQQTAELLGLGPWRPDPRLAPRSWPDEVPDCSEPKPPGGESLADVRARVASWVTEPDEADAVVAVSHAEIVIWLRQVLEGTITAHPLATGPAGPIHTPDNCGVVVYSRISPGGAVADRFRWRAWVPEPWSAPPGWDEHRLLPVG
jgi:broad specificity phosphatase PhoE